MRYFVTLTAVMIAVQLSAGMVTAQETTSSESGTGMYEPESYDSLLQRVEQLEANQGVSPSTAFSQGAFYAQYDNVIVKPYLSQNSAFPTQDVNGGVGNQAFDLGLEYSPRIELGYKAPTSELGFRARFWHFQTESNAGPADGTNGLIGSDAIAIAVGATVQDVDTVTSVAYDLSMDVLDLEATRSFGNHSTLAAGVRTAWMGQKYNAITDEEPLNTRLDVTGVGPTVAYEWRSPSPWVEELSWIAGVRGSLLYGGKDVNSVGENSYRYDEASMMYNAEAQLGLEYRPSNGFFFRAALETQYWANTGNATNQNTGAGDDAGDDEFVGGILEDDLGFLGMVFSAGYQW